MKYVYSGPLSGVTLKDGTEVLLHPGAAVELPEDNRYVKTLRARGHLRPDGDAVNGSGEKEGEIKVRSGRNSKEGTTDVS